MNHFFLSFFTRRTLTENLAWPGLDCDPDCLLTFLGK